MWTNLIDNAIDALDGSGQIFIRTRHDDAAVIVEIADQARASRWTWRLRIFDSFFSTKEVGKGTGLGLDIVRRIVVDAHHGEISVESVPGDTRFNVSAGPTPGSATPRFMHRASPRRAPAPEPR